LTMPRAWMIGSGIRSVPMRKLLRERSVCAPHSASAAISSGPKASLSVRAGAEGRVGDLREGLAIIRYVLGTLALFLAKAVEPHHLGAAGGPGRLRQLGIGGRDGGHRATRSLLARLLLGVL